MDKLRKNHIAQQLRTLIVDNPEYEVMELLRAVLRRKNFHTQSDYKFNLNVSDTALSVALEKTINELSNGIN